MKHLGLLFCLAGSLAAPLSARNVTLTSTPRVVGRTIVIQGTTDLPDQAVIEWELRHELFNKRHDIPISKMACEGHAIVHSHHYSVSIDLSSWPTGEVEVWVAFQPLSYGTRQPAFINAMYGRDGERIEGEHVSIHPAHMRRVELIEHVRLGKGPSKLEADAHPRE